MRKADTMDCLASTLQSPEAPSTPEGPTTAPSTPESPSTPEGPFTSARHDEAGDRDLLRRISCADRRAFEQLYLGYHKRLVKFLFRVLRRYEDLEEVINDAFLIVWQHAGDFRGASRVSTWIFGIAYRCALKSIRRSMVRERGAALEIHVGERVVEDAGRVTEDRQLLEFGISRLPPEQRLVFVLAYCMDHSCEEIAAIVACPVNTVKSRMWHARRKLRTIISAAAAPRGIVPAEDGVPVQTEGLELLSANN